MRSEIGAELEALCRSCGLCCDGSLFGRVPLAPDELPRARRHRLRVLRSGAAFEQPCPALATTGDGFRCAIYADRPRACRAFRCRLYDRHRREGGLLAARLEAVVAVRTLLASLDRTSDGDSRRAAIAELGRRIEEDFARASTEGVDRTE